MTQNTKPATVATLFIEAFGKGDAAAMAEHLADDVTFESPRVRLSGRETVLAAIGEFAQAVTGVTITSVLGDEDQAMIMYEMETAAFGTIRAVDHLRIQDGKIQSDVLIFDTSVFNA